MTVPPGTFTVDIEDDAPPVSGDLTAGITTDINNSHVSLSIVTHFAITNGHGVYYTDVNDVPVERAAYYDIPSRSLTLIGEL